MRTSRLNLSLAALQSFSSVSSPLDPSTAALIRVDPVGRGKICHGRSTRLFAVGSERGYVLATARFAVLGLAAEGFPIHVFDSVAASAAWWA